MSFSIPLSFCFSGNAPGEGALTLAHSHDMRLTLLSFLIAAFASYVALNLGDRIGRTQGAARLGWLLAAALCMGGGIWSMHFIAMLAFSIGVPVEYDRWITLLSLVVAVLVTGIAFHVVGGRRNSPKRLLLGGAIMGLGVAAMHYVGMAAMQMVAVTEYNTLLFGASVLIAMAAATVALYLAFNLQFSWQRIAAGLVMAVAICGMHYTGMAAAHFRWPTEIEMFYGSNEHGLLAIAVALGTQMILMLALLSAFVDRKLTAANEAARAKSAFLATMSHEIRTPMNGVIGMIELLERSGLRADQMKMLSTIRGSSLSLLRIIDDILDFSKIEASKLDIERIPFDPLEVLESALAILAPAAASKGLRLVGYCDPALPRAVLGDPTRLRQILLNLGGNAVKFTAAGRVVIRAEQMERQGDGTVRLRLRVTDTGIGIAESARERLFQPFSQAEATITRQFGGTGLGLSISHRLTTLMGGSIGVESEAGAGSEFWVIVPLAPAPAPEAAPPTADLSQLRCVVVSNDADEALAIRRYLEPQVRALTLYRAPEELADPAGWTGANQVLLADAALVDAAWLARLPRAVGIALITDQSAMVPEGTVRLDRPIRRADLLDAVALAAGLMSPSVAPDAADAASTQAGPSREEALAQGRLLLVAEDHETNRLVLGAQLRRLGFAADFAVDGAEALRLAQRTGYAALLSDVHMPQMDGFELTRRLRALEQEQPQRRRLPIVAVTANALRGEAERCFEAGMNDFLSKPVTLRELRRVLLKWLPQAPLAGSAPAGSAPAGVPTTLDTAGLLELVGGDPALVGAVLASFGRMVADAVAQIASAATARDKTVTMRKAHGLKGAARTACANRIGCIAAGIEASAADADWPAIDRQLFELKQELTAVEAAIAAAGKVQPATAATG